MINIQSSLTKVDCQLQRMEDLVEIISAGLDAVDPEKAVKRNLELRENLLYAGSTIIQVSDKTRIITIALGKASPAMMNSAIACLGDKYQGGVCVCKHMEVDYIKEPATNYIVGNHPVPGEGSLQAGIEIRNAVTGLSADDIVLLLISGGGSSLVTLPVEGVSLADLQAVTSTLLRSGANIAELNTVRKHLDLIKGGGLVRLAAPAKVAALVLSDVVGNNLEVIASGPAYPDPTTFAEALTILSRAERYGPVPENIVRYLKEGLEGKNLETLKIDDPDTGLGFNSIIASNKDACAAAVKKAIELGFSAELVTDSLVGEARAAGSQIVTTMKNRKDLHKRFMLVWGGETTVTVTGQGKGGRNLELALAAVKEMAGLNDKLLLTLATDGEDGPTDAAGAVVSGGTLQRAIDKGLDPDDYLRNNNAYAFFGQLGDLLITGPTGTNVNDLSFVFGF